MATIKTMTSPNNKRFFTPSSHASRLIARDINLPLRQTRVLFLLLENFSIVSFTGAADVLVTANLLSADPIFDVQTASIDGGKVTSDLGIEVTVNGRLDSFNVKSVDVLVICGGLRTRLQVNPVIERFVKRAVEEEIWVGGLWNGAYYLAGTGIFDQYECSIHPDSRELLKERYPNSRLSKACHMVDGKTFSCVGPNSSIRVMLELLERIFGNDMRLAVNGILLSDSNRSVNYPSSNGNFIPQNLETIIELMENNLEEPLDINDLSEYTSLSRRQVERLFARYLNTSPSRYYMELRLNKGRQLLLKTNYRISEVAVACGFTSQTHFSHSFKMIFGASPTSVRQEGKDIF